MKSKLVIAAVLGLVAGLLSAGASSALPGVVQCGQVITADTTLMNDVGPCPADGIIIGANDVTLNLNGHKVYGVPTPQAKLGLSLEVRVSGLDPIIVETEVPFAYTATTGVGVRVGDPVTGASTSIGGGYSGVEVLGPGTITQFDAGVAIEGGSGNKVEGVSAINNFSDAQANAIVYGDGIALNGSNGNTIANNTVVGNGPYSGVSVFGGGSGNTFSGNLITDNNRFADRSPVHHGAVGFTQETDGVRVEPGSNDNTVANNTVLRNGLDGIALFPLTTNNTVTGNTVNDNGYDVPLQEPASQRRGDGIRLFGGVQRANGTIAYGASDSLVQDNLVFRNAAHGIILGNFAVNNEILSNDTGDNVVMDLKDENAATPCDNNVWQGNTYDTAQPACTTG